MKQVPCTVRTIYQFGNHQERVEVEFYRIPKDRPAPGFTHRVLVSGWGQTARYWLSEDYRPNAKAARFFYDKFIAEQAAKAVAS